MKYILFYLFALLLLPVPSIAITPKNIPIRPMRHNPPQKPGKGLQNHQVYSASSLDSLNWVLDGKLLFDTASVPDAVINKQGEIFLYFVDASDGHFLSVAKSVDLGKSWEKSKVLIENKQNPGDAVDPNPVLLQDGRIRLFYLGNFITGGPMKKGGTHKIYSALSSDGINFVEEKGVRVTHIGITDPDAVRYKGGWKIFVSLPQEHTNLSYSSIDGLKFKKDEKDASQSGSISSTIKVPKGYRMYKCDRGSIASQFSTDLVNWIEEGPRLRGPYCDPGVIKLPDGSYKMFYKTFKKPI